MPCARHDIRAVLTNHLLIVIARAPRRTRKPKPGPKITRVIVGPREPAVKAAVTAQQEIAPQPTRGAVIVGRKVAPEIPDKERDHAPAEAAERLWREMVRRVEAGRHEDGPQQKGAPRADTERL
jgi:hypothetical protein